MAIDREQDTTVLQDLIDTILRLRGQGMQTNAPRAPWGQAGPDRVPAPGQRNYLSNPQMASAERPMPAPDYQYNPHLGYWLAGTPASTPWTARGQYLDQMRGPSLGGSSNAFLRSFDDYSQGK